MAKELHASYCTYTQYITHTHCRPEHCPRRQMCKILNIFSFNSISINCIYSFLVPINASPCTYTYDITHTPCWPQQFDFPMRFLSGSPSWRWHIKVIKIYTAYLVTSTRVGGGGGTRPQIMLSLIFTIFTKFNAFYWCRRTSLMNPNAQSPLSDFVKPKKGRGGEGNCR